METYYVHSQRRTRNDRIPLLLLWKPTNVYRLTALLSVLPDMRGKNGAESMKLTIMNMFTAEGTPEQLSEYTTRVMLKLKSWTDKQEQKQIQNEIESIWKNTQKGGESEH